MSRYIWTDLTYYRLDLAKTYLGFADYKVSEKVDRAVHNCLGWIPEEHARSRYYVGYQLKLAERALVVISESSTARTTIATCHELHNLIAIIQKQLSELAAIKGENKWSAY